MAGEPSSAASFIGGDSRDGRDRMTGEMNLACEDESEREAIEGGRSLTGPRVHDSMRGFGGLQVQMVWEISGRARSILKPHRRGARERERRLWIVVERVSYLKGRDDVAGSGAAEGAGDGLFREGGGGVAGEAGAVFVGTGEDVEEVLKGL